MKRRNKVYYYVKDDNPSIYIPGRITKFYREGKYARFIDCYNMDRIVLTSDLEELNYKGCVQVNGRFRYMTSLRQLKKQWAVKAYGYSDDLKAEQRIIELEAE